MIDLDAVIVGIEQELGELDQQRQRLTAALVALRPIAAGRATRTSATTLAKPRPTRTPTARTATDGAKAASTFGGALDVIQARDAAILAHLKKHAPASRSALCAILPKEPGQTDEQRLSACQNALTRLRVKKLVKQTDQGWGPV